MRLAIVLLALGLAQAKFTPTKSDSRPLPDPEQFKATAVPLVQAFIFSRYDDFAASKVCRSLHAVTPHSRDPAALRS
jgi:hypothetical protein